VAVLDEDHKKLVTLLNDLHYGIASGQGTERLGMVLNGLASYAATHFAHEEELFAQTNYPDAEQHIKEHREFTRKLLEIYARYNKGQFDALSRDTFEFLKTWLHNHVLDVDKKYEAHLHANGIR
jgi:hemerythrin